ncbi:MAG: lipopolysaccharide biosynthesis protein, partial [Sphingomicrobium sp.]
FGDPLDRAHTAPSRRMPMRHWFKDQHFRSLLKNTSYLAVSKGVAAVASIVTLAMAGRSLGLVLFGVLILITSYAQAASGLSKFQSWQLIIRYGAAALAKNDETSFKRAASFGLGLDIASGLVGMAAAMLLLPLLGPYFGIKPAYLAFGMAYCLLIPTMGASSPTGMLRALDRFDLLSWQGTLTPIARAALATFGFLHEWSLPGFVALWAAADLLGDLFLWFLAWREVGRRGYRKGMSPTLRPVGLDAVWPFAIQVNLTSSLMSAWGPIARLIVGGLLGEASAAIYRVAASLADSAQKPGDLLSKAFYPEVVRMDMTTKRPWKFMLRGSAIAAAFGLVSIGILVVGGESLIKLLFASRSAQFLPVYPVLLVMVGVPLLAILSFPLPPMLYALDRADGPLKARIVATIVYFAIVAPLCWRFDTIGAAIAIVAANAVLVAILMIMVRREHRRMRAK